MKKVLLLSLVLLIGATAFAQTKIQLRSADKAECVKSDMTSLKASFSFSTIEAEDIATKGGDFSWLSMPNTVLGGNEGDPQIPVVNELIAVPFGANPTITVTSYSSTDYQLNELGIKTLIPRQPSVRKDKNPEDVPFVYNASAYQTRGMRSEPMATVSVQGTMRGIQIGTMTIEPVSYDPVSNTIRVFNDIEVKVSFDGADTQATEDMLLRTYSPAFEPVYGQLFNGKAVRDVYSDHPDLYNTPVKMLVICYSGFEGNSALNEWLQWKLQKGYYVDIYYTGTGTNNAGTTATNIKNFIKTKYNASVSAGNAYTYLIVIGDTGQVPQYMTKTVDESCASDLGYSCVNFTTSSTSNYFPDMYYSRMSVENTTHLTNYINKVLTYERYEFADGGNYLNNVILVGGWDSSWTSSVAKPTINYGKNNYFNSSNTTYGGFGSGTISATISTSSSAGYSGTNNGVYNGINNGVCFLNYTAHGDKQEWYQPKLSATQAATLTNTGKYFFAVGNCCLTGNFNNTSTTYSPGSDIGTNACFAETMIRVPNAGAVAYIGCSPYSYWYEDFYWAVGAHSYSAGNAPSVSTSSTGVYDAMFNDANWNSASALLYLGNLAVQQAVTNNNTNSSSSMSGDVNNSAHYYFQFYHTFGDGSVMPYITKPETNNVTIPSIVNVGETSITVNAVAGSYVAVTDNSSVIYGVAEANSNGVATVNFTNAIPSSGTLHVVVTRQQYQPYFGTIDIIATGEQYNITASANPTAGGTVQGAGTYYENQNCTLIATATRGYRFVNWTKNNVEVSTNATYTFQVTANAAYVAHFEALEQPGITYNTNQEHGTINVDPADAYEGETVHLTATPATGYELNHWDVNTVGKGNVEVLKDGDGNDYFIMPDKAVTIEAVFSVKLDPETLTINGTSTTTNTYVPFYGNYADYGTISQFIIPASDIQDITAGSTISKITFYCNKASQSYFGSKVEVKIGEVSYTSFSSTTFVTSGLTTVTSSSTTTLTTNSSSELEITFETPYTYQGGNLLISIGGYGSKYASTNWTGVSKSDNVAIYKNNSSNNGTIPSGSGTAVKFAPKTTITYTPSINPSISLTPNAATVLTGFTQTLTANTHNISGTPAITYTSSNTNVATVNGNGTTATVTAVAPGTATITATMNYEGTAYTATCAITVEDPSYCEPSFSSPSDDYIKQFVTTGGITNISNTSTYETGGYSDFYSTQSASVGVGETLSCTVTPSSTSWKYGHAIWVDWNKDYEFTSDERVAYTSSAASGNWTGSVTVPANANGGDYRMRVIHFYNQASPSDPCVSGQYGEAEDYKITVIANGTKYTITATANPTAGGTVTGAGQYYEDTQCTLTATPNANYAFANWTKDGAVVSTNATYSFTVTEDASYVANFDYINTVKIMPNDPEYGSVAFGGNRETLTYDFEDGWQNWTAVQGTTGNSPHNWMHNTEYTAYSSNGNVIDLTTSGYNSSTGFMLSESYISAATSGGTATGAVYPDNYLISPKIRLGGSMTFYAAGRTTDCAEKFTVMVSTTTNISDFVATSFTVTLSSQTYTQYTVDLSGYSEMGEGYVIFHHYDCTDQHMLRIDDITIVEGEVNDGSLTASYVNGTSCTVVATANEGYHFANWTENSSVVSTNASYTFTVTADRDLVANFTQTPYYTISVTINPAEGGTVTGAGSYAENSSATLTATANEGYAFVNWTQNGEVVSSNNTYEITTVTEDAEYVANFVQVISQDITLVAGWNWWTPTVEITLAELEDALGDYGVTIKSKDANVSKTDFGWRGTLTTIEVGVMYMIKTNADCTITMTGAIINPAEHPITLNPNATNWVGFIGTEETNLNDIPFNPTSLDVIKTHSGTAVYYSNKGWRGNISTLKPGEGYMYKSKASAKRTFTYPSAE